MWKKCADTSKESGKPSRALSRQKTIGGKGMTPTETIAEINRQLDHCNARQLTLVLKIIQDILK